MRTYLLLLFFLLALAQSSLWAQGEKQVFSLPAPLTLSTALEEVHQLAIVFDHPPEPFIAAYLHLPQTHYTQARLRWRNGHNTTWSEWHTLQEDGHLSDEKIWASVPLFLEADAQEVEVHLTRRATAAARALQPVLTLFNPQMHATAASLVAAPPAIVERGGCPCDRPDIQPRSSWNAPTLPATCQSMTTPTHLIVHHSATSNTSPNWAATVLSIWRAHLDRAFCDVGYNYLIDPNGVIYEGRVNGEVINITGAHFCGTNGGTMGVCMLGNYSETTPSDAAISSLVKLLGWRACTLGIDPLGTVYHPSSRLTLSNISGHRDGCATECPGNLQYPLLPSIRTQVKMCNEPTATHTYGQQWQLSIQPNPVQSKLHLNIQAPHAAHAALNIYNALGNLMQTQQLYLGAGEQHNTIELANLPTGVYWLSISLGTQTATKLFMKM